MPTNPANPFSILSNNPEHTRKLGLLLGALLQPGDVICLQGELGAGKTTFVQGLAAGWGSLDTVSSPTFVIVNVYRRFNGGQLFHFDTYRLESAPEAEELDLDDMINNGSLIIEWPERMESVLPAEKLWITLDYVFQSEPDPKQDGLDPDDIRRITFFPAGERYTRLLDEFIKSVPG